MYAKFFCNTLILLLVQLSAVFLVLKSIDQVVFLEHKTSELECMRTLVYMFCKLVVYIMLALHYYDRVVQQREV